MFFKLAQDLTYWSAGGVSGVRPEQVRLLLPWTIGGLLLALCMTRSVAILSLGEEVATGLGGKVAWIKLGASIAVLILTGSSVAIAGPISFVGLVTPHAVKAIVGSDYRKIIPCSMLAGAVLLGIVEDLSFEIPEKKITALIGANGSGKSTILKTMCRIMAPAAGQVILDGKEIHRQSTKELARKLSILPQNPESPEGLTVEELVAYGRSPHKSGYGCLNDEADPLCRTEACTKWIPACG